MGLEWLKEENVMRPSSNGRQVLNAMDLCVLRHSQAVRAIGCRGLTMQMQVWLDKPLDVAVLRTALTRLSRAYPVVTSRLTERPGRSGVFWQFRPGALCELREVTVPRGGETEALNTAANILTLAGDPAEADPVEFYLLRLPDGRDLFLVQHDHCLADINGTKLLLREINRLATQTLAEPVPDEKEDGIRTYLRRYSFWQRLRTLWQLPARERPFRDSEPVTLSDTALPVRGGTPRIAVRELDEQATRAFLTRTTRLCGFPSPSMALLASIFRGILRHSPHPLTERSAFMAYAGTNLRSRGARGPLFRNLGSLLSVICRPDEMVERDKLVLLLNRQVREQMSRNTDLAILQCVWWLRHRARLLLRRAGQAQHHHCLNFGYLGELVAPGERFCGVPVRRKFPVTQVWSPPALSIAPGVCRGRLVLPAVYMADTVPEPRIQAFLDTVVADLAA
jgi:hypothetical protein